MSGYRFERYKDAREEDENELAARCARYWTHQGISQPPDGSPATANASHTGCPCDPIWPENPNQPAGCEYLSYEQLPYKPVPRGKYDREIDFALALLGLFFFFVCLIFIYRKFKRDERVRVFDEQFDLEMRARVEDAERRAEHSGRSFVAVRQPTGELELAEVVVVVVVAADAEDQDCAADREGEEERTESARTARRDASDEEARARTGDEETATVDEPRGSPTATDPTSDDASAASRAR